MRAAESSAGAVTPRRASAESAAQVDAGFSGPGLAVSGRSPEAVAQRRLAALANRSEQARTVARLQRVVNQAPAAREAAAPQGADAEPETLVEPALEGEAPIQRFAITAIPAKEQYARSDFKGNDTLKGELAAIKATLSQNLIDLRTAKVSSTLLGGQTALERTNAVKDKADDAYFLSFSDGGRFSQAKANRILGYLTDLRASQIDVENQALINSVRPKTTIVTVGASRGRIIAGLEAKRTGAALTFGDAGLASNGAGMAQTWGFTDAADQAWTIQFVAGADVQDSAAADGAAHTITVTIGNNAIHNDNAQTYEKEIIDHITFAYRRAARGADDALSAGSAVNVRTDSDDEALAGVKRLYDNYQAARVNLLAVPNDMTRQRRTQEARTMLRRKILSLGVADPAKLNLATAGVNDADLKDVMTSESLHEGFKAYTAQRGGVDPDTEKAPQLITPELILHMIKAEARGFGEHKLMGISGGHDDQRLLAFVAVNPLYHVVRTSQVTTTLDLGQGAENMVVSKYDQYMWNQAAHGAPPAAGSALRPGGAQFDAAQWSKADVPKTTVTNLEMFLHLGASAARQWVAADARRKTEEGEVSGPTAKSAQGNVGFTGYVRSDPVGGLKKLETLFVSG